MRILTIILLLIWSNLSAQPNIWRSYFKKNGLCATSLILYSDSNYFFETGCEGRSNVNFGTWTSNKKIIKLTPIDTANFKSLKSISTGKDEISDSTITIKIYDLYDQPIEKLNLAFIPSPFNQDIINERSNLTVKVQDGPDVIIKCVATNKSGLVDIIVPSEGIIKLVDIKSLMHENVIIEADNLRFNEITIRLNLNKEVFKYPQIKWWTLVYDELKNQEKKLQFITK